MDNSLLVYLKELYIKAKENKFEWKPIYSNNMPSNGVEGVYTDFFISRSNSNYTYYKYSIEYMSRCDENGLSHPEEGVKYYVLHKLCEYDLDKTFEIPVPTDEFSMDSFGNLVNTYGRFRYVFDDEDTAKKVVCSELFHIIYPYLHILTDEELADWNKFISLMD